MNTTPDDTDALPFPRLFAQFHTGYVACALWASADEDGTPLDELGLELSEDATNQSAVLLLLLAAWFGVGIAEALGY